MNILNYFFKKNIVKGDSFNYNYFNIAKETKQLNNVSYSGIIEPPFDFNTLADLFTSNGYHSRCCYLKALITAGNGFELISENENEKNQVFDFINNLNKNFIETLVNIQLDYELYGNAFIEIVRNLKGEITELFHIPAKNCKIFYDNKNIKLVQTIGIKQVYFNPFNNIEQGVNEFIQIKNYNPKNEFYGIPEYLGCLASLYLDRVANEFNINRFNNNAIPESIILVKGASFENETKQAVKEFFIRNTKGVQNAGRTLILEVDKTDAQIEVKPIATEVKEASFRGLRIDTRDEIITTHGVPKRLLGIAEPGGLGGGSEGKSQMKIFQDCLINPRQVRLEYIFNELILKNRFENLTTKFQLKRLDVSDAKADATFYQTMLANGVLTPEQVAEELGYEYKAENINNVINKLIEFRKQLND